MTGIRKRFLLIAALLILQVLVSIISGLVLASTPRDNHIFPGVFIGGVDVGGLTREQAVKLLGDTVNQKLDNGQIILKYKDRQWSLKYIQLGVRFDVPASVDRAMQISQKSTVISESIAMFQTRYRTFHLPLVVTKEENIQTAIAGICAEISTPARNADLKYNDGDVVLVPEIVGQVVELSSSIQRIKEAIGQLKTAPVELAVREISPQVTRQEMKGIKDSLGVGLATLSRSAEDAVDRETSIIERLNGQLVRPGEIFSFNKAVGDTVKERGYHFPIITGGRLEDGSDTVVNRVASALYQAVIYAGLEIRERHAHLSAPDYISLGQDAAVTASQFDLKFVNNTKNAVFIKASLSARRISIHVFGTKAPGQTVQVITSTSTGQGQEYQGMQEVKVQRIYYNRGVQSRKELLSQDRYQ